jgi:hypothetical protein
MYGRRYLWHGTDLLEIEGRLSEEEQLAAVDEAFAEARASRCAPAPSAA